MIVNNRPAFLTQSQQLKSLYRKPDGYLENPDVIVIGSGLGGLAFASTMAQKREAKVLVLEAGPVPGGATSVFEDGGFEFNKGLHSVSEMDAALTPYSVYAYTADYVTAGRVKWAQMPDVHEVTAMKGGWTHEWHSTPEQNIAALSARYPQHAAGIARYYELEKRISMRGAGWAMTKLLPDWVPEWARDAAFSAVGAPWKKYLSRTTTDVLTKELGLSHELATLFSYMYGNYGRTPERAPFTLHAAVMFHYRYGAQYPVGGPGQIANAIVPIIEAAGGQVAVSSGVKEIIVEGNRAVGVRLHDGTEIRSKVIVSGASAYETFMRLLPREVSARHGYTKLFEHLGMSPAHVYLFAGYDQHLELPKHIVWQLPDYDGIDGHDLAAADAQFKQHLRFKGGMAYVISPSARDPLWSQRYPNKSTVIVLAEAGPGWAERVKTDEGFRRELEEKTRESFLEVAQRHFPALRGKTPAYVKVGTPVGCNVNAKDGASYGLEASPERFSRFTHLLRPQTKIEGLYLTGQDPASPGIAGAMFSARFTYAAVTGDLFHTLSREPSPLKGQLPAVTQTASSGDFDKAA